MARLLTGSLVVGFALLASQFTLMAGVGKKSDSVVKIAAVAGKLDAGKQMVQITLDVAKGWHVYANPVKNEDLISAATVVKVNAAAKPASVDVKYPVGKKHTDKVLGDYYTYEGTVAIDAVVQRAAGDASKLEVSVTFMACDDKQCLQPTTITVKVP
jgi:hypothetical protein